MWVRDVNNRSVPSCPASLPFGTSIPKQHRSNRFVYTLRVTVRDRANSYLIENGKIVAQTIHYTVEQK